MQAMTEIFSTGREANIIYFLTLLPAVFALVIPIISRKLYVIRGIVCVLAASLNLLFSIVVYNLPETSFIFPWAGSDYGISFALRVYNFSQNAVLFVGILFFLITIYTVIFLKGKRYNGSFLLLMLLTLALTNGALLANNMIILLFFWEGLLVTLYCMILTSSSQKPRTATKALFLNGFADLLLTLGVIVTCQLTGTTLISDIQQLSLSGYGVLGFTCMMLGAIGKAGSMPFHSWIPDAAEDAPLPMMILLPAALEKILGIYFLCQLTLQLYDFQPGTLMSNVVMLIGGLTIVFAAGMALVQTDLKRMLGFHAVSQVGYMVLGIGTALPIGILGGMFHMLNHVCYKSCLFMGAGVLEYRTGTTDMRKISGLVRFMPVTTLFFLISSFAICGVPFFNGFYSKEIIYQAALNSGVIWYVLALLGSFMTAASFLKACHACFFGPVTLPEGKSREDIYEAPGAMLLPMFFLSLFCLVLGLGNKLILRVLDPIFGGGVVEQIHSANSIGLILASILVLLLAIGNHLVGYRSTGRAVNALHHIRTAPGLKSIYSLAINHYLDPYNLFMLIIKTIAWIGYALDRGINWIYDTAFASGVVYTSDSMHDFNTGNISRYLTWTFLGIGVLIILFIILL